MIIIMAMSIMKRMMMGLFIIGARSHSLDIQVPNTITKATANFLQLGPTTHLANIQLRNTKYKLQQTPKIIFQKSITRPHTSCKHPDERYKMQNTKYNKSQKNVKQIHHQAAHIVHAAWWEIQITKYNKRMLNKSTTRSHTSCKQPDEKYKIQNTTNNKRMLKKIPHQAAHIVQAAWW